MKLATVVRTVLSVALGLTFGPALSLAASTREIAKLVSPSGLVMLSDANYASVVAGPRDYDIVVLLTAGDPKFGCQFCQVFYPLYEKLAYSWKRDHKSSDGLFFAVADVADSRATYASLALTHAPNLFVYPRTNSSSDITEYQQYQFPQADDHLPGLQRFLAKTLGHNIVIREPIRTDRLAITAAMVVGTIGALYVLWTPISAFVTSKKLWTGVALVTVLMFTAGHMYNVIRHSPYVAGDGKGGVMYWYGGGQNQLAVETQIIAFTYAGLAFSVIALVVRVPKIQNGQVQMLLAMILTAGTLLLQSYLMSRFKIKNESYPYRLPPF